MPPSDPRLPAANDAPPASTRGPSSGGRPSASRISTNGGRPSVPEAPKAPPPPPPPEGSSRRSVALLVGALIAVPVAAIVVAKAVLPHVTPAIPSAPVTASVTVSAPVVDSTPEVRGKILDADGEPVEGAAVRLVSPQPPFDVLRETKSDGAGGFRFPQVGAAVVRVVADHVPSGVVTSAELRPTPGNVTDIVLVLSPASVVRGLVVDPNDKPIAGASINVEGAPWITRAVTSDDAGEFRVLAVPREANGLTAVARGFKSARVTLPFRNSDADVVVKIQLAASPNVEGDIRDPDGNPVRARVVACEGSPAEARTVSSNEGTFELPPATIGCTVIAQHDQYSPSDEATIVEGRRVTLRLRAGGGIAGVVVDDAGHPVPQFSVGIESFAAATSKSFHSAGARPFEDPNGAFRWDKLAPGSYVLTASAPGKPPTRSDSIEVAGGLTTSGVRITLMPGGTVSGRVFDENKAPVAGATLAFDAVSSTMASDARATTDESGAYKLEGAPSGPFTLRVEKQGFRTRMVSGLRVEPRATLTQDVTLKAGEGGGLDLGGIGATLVQTREGLSMQTVAPNDPAGRAGLQGGDRLVRIDGESTEGMSVADAIQRLRGEVGTSVGVTAFRPSTGETRDYTLVRGAISR